MAFLKIAAAIVIFQFVVACGGASVYMGQPMWEDVYKPLHGKTGGYSFGTHRDHWGVTFKAATKDFSILGARYRAAEATYEKGMRYFEVKAEKTRFLGGVSGGHKSSTQYDGQPYTYVEFYLRDEMAAGGKTFDAYKILNEQPVPGTNVKKTVKSRKNSQAEK